MNKQDKRLTGIVFSVLFLLLIPLIAMQLTDEVNWTAPDFIAAAILLLSTGLSCELVIREIIDVKYRIVICFLLVTALLLIWGELAVGII